MHRIEGIKKRQNTGLNSSKVILSRVKDMGSKEAAVMELRLVLVVECKLSCLYVCLEPELIR